MTEPLKNNSKLINVTRSELLDCLESIEEKNQGYHLIPKTFSVDMNGLKGFGVNYVLIKTIKDNGKEIVPVGLVVIGENDKASYQLYEEFRSKPSLIKPSLILN